MHRLRTWAAAVAAAVATTVSGAAPASALPPVDPPAQGGFPGQVDVPTRSTHYQRSTNLYRIPYVDGTAVTVSRDTASHTPGGRIDMNGTGGTGPYRVAAADGGQVMFIEDGNTVHSEPECTTGYNPNNYVWIRHDSGEWSKYSHLATGSVTGAAGLAEGDVVARGTFLGYESDIGCAHGVHLHFEVAVPDSLTHPINEDGGYVIGRNLEPSVCGDGVAMSRFEDGQTYTATNCHVLVNPDLGTGPGDLVIEQAVVPSTAVSGSRSAA